jgi:hypothetical protein
MTFYYFLAKSGGALPIFCVNGLHIKYINDKTPVIF